jgi:N-acyl-D-aspartate/D-glutamate deacylase
MGERAFTETASDDDLEVMRHELSDALRAGAVGFTTSRSASHWTSDDRPVASRVAAWDEVVALVEFMGQQGAGVFQLAPEPTRRRNGEPNDFDARLQQLALSTGVPVVYGVIAQQGTALIDDTVARGGRMYGLTHSRGVSMVQSFLTTLAFDVLPEWQEVRSRPLDEQRVLLRDPAVRARLVHAANHGDYAGLITAGRVGPRFEWMDVLLTGSGPNPTVAEVAAARGVDPVEAIIDLALDHDLDLFFLQYFDDRDPERVLALMRNPNTAMTFSDSGAHVSQVIDSSIHSYLLGSWVRERELLSLEEAVAMMTSRSARIFGLHDRGLLAEGYAADVTVFDPATVAPSMPRLVYDLPGGARRLEQRADGIRAVVVNGGVLLRDGELTEERSGRLLRAGQLQPS